jgi:antirestriction protein ArdC
MIIVTCYGKIQNRTGLSGYVAEMGAAFLSTECGISQATIDDSASYIGSWIKHLRADPKLVVHAAGKAQKAVSGRPQSRIVLTL